MSIIAVSSPKVKFKRKSISPKISLVHFLTLTNKTLLPSSDAIVQLVFPSQINKSPNAVTPNTIEEIIGNVQPTTSNGAEAPLTFELPKYTNPISTNTPIDENGDLVLPPTVDKLEYTGTLSTNTPIDKDGNLILPPIVEIPEYKDDIVNEPQKDTKEPQQSQNNNKQIPTEIYHQSDKKQDVINNNIEVDNNKIVQKQALPKTNALNSSVYVLGLLLSIVGLKHNKKD